jgi:hypothetical protein
MLVSTSPPARMDWDVMADLAGLKVAMTVLFKAPPHAWREPTARDLQATGMPFLLSIRTVFPRKGGRVWYDDQRHVHGQIFASDEEPDYAFMGTDPLAPENVWLRDAAERQIPLIYFLGVPPGGTKPSSPLSSWTGTLVADRPDSVRRTRGCHCLGHSTGRGRAPLCSPPGEAETASGVLQGQRARRLRASMRDQQPAR